jgi:hypothetical protein
VQLAVAELALEAVARHAQRHGQRRRQSWRQHRGQDVEGERERLDPLEATVCQGEAESVGVDGDVRREAAAPAPTAPVEVPGDAIASAEPVLVRGGLAAGEPDDAEAGAGAAGADGSDLRLHRSPPPFEEADLDEGALSAAGQTEAEITQGESRVVSRE